MSTCGCCEATAAVTPLDVANRHGRASLRRRVGTHGAFLASMRAELARIPALRDLALADVEDPLGGLLDAWAAALHVLGFYQERIANEGYLATATERASVLALARQIGHELRPGVAATTDLAFTVDDVPGDDDGVPIPAGTAAQSVPAPGGTAHWFETVEEITARPRWNTLAPARTERPAPDHGDRELVLDGIATGLAVGDSLVLVGDEWFADHTSERWDLRRVAALDVAPGDADVPGRTVVTLDRPLGSVQPYVRPARANQRVFALRERVPLFGHAAPSWADLPLPLRVGERHPTTNAFLAGPYAGQQATWADRPFPAGTTRLHLSRSVPGVVAGALLVLAGPDYGELYRVDEAVDESITRWLQTGTVTRVELDGENVHRFSPRTAVALCRSEELALGARPRTDPVTGSELALATLVAGIRPGRRIAVTGARADGTGQEDGEVATVYTVTHTGGATTLRLADPLAGAYARATVVVHANVAAATHGRTRAGLQPGTGLAIGSGDGRFAFQRFPLPEPPLTYVRDTGPSGAASTLEVRVDGLVWHEVDHLYGQRADARVYTTRRADDGTVTVTFGDGVTGARLPTGTDNVTVTYRTGIGLAASVDRAAITQLMSRPLGVSAVTNPVPAAGAADPEALADARRNAPVPVLTLGRIVSVRDAEAFVASYAGIGKAQAVELWWGRRRSVHVTVAAADGGAVSPDLLADLRVAVDAARHPTWPVVLAAAVHRPVAVVARVQVDGSHRADDVLASARGTLLAAFGWQGRAFAQSLAASEVHAVLHAVDGVNGVVLDALHPRGEVPAVARAVPGRPARVEAGAFVAADLVTLDPGALVLTERTS